MKFIVETEEQKKELLTASKYLHDLTDIDTDIPMVNFLCHIYLVPETIEVQLKEKDGRT